MEKFKAVVYFNRHATNRAAVEQTMKSAVLSSLETETQPWEEPQYEILAGEWLDSRIDATLELITHRQRALNTHKADGGAASFQP